MQIEAVNQTQYETFRPNSYFENLLRLKTTDPQTFAILSPSEKIALAVYSEQKEAAQTGAASK